tara:strand:+ start:9081 stop:9410 length:330 start_codon:yes stop_codon:yes gene_type:complete
VDTPDTDGMSVYADLVCDPNAGDLLDNLGIIGNKTYPDGVENCVNCGYKKLANLEVLGAHSKPLFYICRRCSHLHLRFTRPYTMKCILKAESLYSNPLSWDMPQREDYD